MTARAKTPPLFVLAPAADMAAELHLPGKTTNLFQRLIRNPHADSDRAKERECAEMLCALLQNAPTLRRHLLGWLAGRVNFDARKLDELRFDIDTEQPIGGKRDDLRIVGSFDRSGDERPVLIWTIEIKVGASFHESGAQFGDDAADVGEREPLQVNQLLNYDHWLAQQPVEHRAGFVLALYDRTADLPKLSCSWACFSWTALGEQIAAALRSNELGAGEQVLAKHALGFIRDNLWRTSEMSDKRLDYNDVSLIRAFATLAKDCDEKVNRLVESLQEVLQKSGIGRGPVSHTKSLFKGQICSYVEREMPPQSCIYAGIGGDEDTGEDYLCVAIETPRNYPKKEAFRAMLARMGDSLRKRK